jgi:hypothetical protein
MTLAQQWRSFKNDEPGKRFIHQRERMKKEGRGLTVALVALGALLFAGGVVLLFIPGPGLVLIVFGLALVSGVSSKLARLLYRTEPPVRRFAGRWRRRIAGTWRRLRSSRGRAKTRA